VKDVIENENNRFNAGLLKEDTRRNGNIHNVKFLTAYQKLPKTKLNLYSEYLNYS